MDLVTDLGTVGLGFGALSIVMGFLGVRQGRRTDQVLASEGDKTRALITDTRESTQSFIASEGDKTRSLVLELHESTKNSLQPSRPSMPKFSNAFLRNRDALCL